ncbi:MAG: MFS transporter [Planctomycetaceae bacterium]
MTTKHKLLYVVCILTDFAAFVVIFTISRQLAEAKAEPYYLGIVGAGFSFIAGVGSILGGLLSQRCDSRTIFNIGAAMLMLSTAGCGFIDPRVSWMLPVYWSLGFGLGFIYPPLIGWLNQGEDVHANRQGVSRTLILFCVAWNFGMMCGQLTAGSLFAMGKEWPIIAAFLVSVLNLGFAIAATLMPSPPVAAEPVAGAAIHPDAEIAISFKRLSWIANLGGMFGGSLVVHLLPDLAVKIGIPADDHGYLLAGWRAVIIVTYGVLHFAAFWHYRFGVAVVSQVLAAVGLIVISQAESSTTLLIGLTLLGQLVGFNYFSGLFYSTAGSSHHRRALAAGIHEATLAAGMAVGTIVGGVLGSWVNIRIPYMMSAFVLLVLVVVQGVAWWMWIRPVHQRRTAAQDERALLSEATGG